MKTLNYFKIKTNILDDIIQEIYQTNSSDKEYASSKNNFCSKLNAFLESPNTNFLNIYSKCNLKIIDYDGGMCGFGYDFVEIVLIFSYKIIKKYKH